MPLPDPQPDPLPCMVIRHQSKVEILTLFGMPQLRIQVPIVALAIRNPITQTRPPNII